ncbi:alanine racemase [Terriglobus roseus DSM 18391]|uniref:Alanine racemase n=1 Tax=Terriglobus roseus (strain DSM 18391 / NRRL B-41598 / KBS 63) TaxID=926566 RepID=I3ZBI3_TERRK|nr:alanine racemase [Terriglobus roseus]AFL86601.1 alanine racemase [Terriglobus roseus DSM 18391]
MRPTPPNHTRPIWAEISASRLRDNFHALQAAAGTQVQVLAVVKADAYGHSATECAPILAAAGAQWLGVTSAEEGLAVRASLAILPQGMTAPRILVMCGLWPGEEAGILDRGLTPVVWEPYHLDLLEAEARRRNLPPQSVAVHAEIDTGMARQGVAPGPLLDRLLQRFAPDSPLKLEGVMTHLASTEIGDDPQNQVQMIAFATALQQVAAAGLRPDYVHAGNTSSTDSGYMPQDLPALAASLGAQAMTRAGLALYGYALPLESVEPQNRVSHVHAHTEDFLSPRLSPKLKPVMTWKTRIVSLREVQCGDTIGYNATFVAPVTMRLALLPVGYADGFRRSLSASNTQPGGSVLLHGRRAPIVGRVSMDLTIVDVTAVPQVNIGDEAILLGESNGNRIGADDHARTAGTSAYEILCGISDRVPRIVVP